MYLQTPKRAVNPSPARLRQVRRQVRRQVGRGEGEGDEACAAVVGYLEQRGEGGLEGRAREPRTAPRRGVAGQAADDVTVDEQHLRERATCA